MAAVIANFNLGYEDVSMDTGRGDSKELCLENGQMIGKNSRKDMG